MKIDEYGWSHFSKENQSLDQSRVARVIKVHRTHFDLIANEGEIEGILSKKNLKLWKNSAQMPSVGDWVVFGETEESVKQTKRCFIQEVIPRKSKLSRLRAGEESIEQIIASNIAVAFIVSSINNDFNLNRIQRYVMIAKNGHVEPVLVLSKIDLNENYKEFLVQINEKFPDLKVIATTRNNPESFDQLKHILNPGDTCVFVGSSGVGKSSIVNFILGHNVQNTGDIREEDDKGKHTTTARSLFLMENGALLIDTPGMREVQVLGDEIVGQEAFGRIEEFATQCKFSNCSHKIEPNCAVQKAIEDGLIEQKEFNLYKKIKGELEYSKTRIELRDQSTAKKKWKKVMAKDTKNKKKFVKKIR